MAREEWYRNRDWSSEIEAAFLQKLRRARTYSKAQYLRIQACTLTDTHPQVALRLLDDYFQCGDNLFDALAHADQASAHLALGDVQGAVQAYEAALAAEALMPNVRSGTRLGLSFLIATANLSARFDQALHLLDQVKSGVMFSVEVMFPVEHFIWHAVHALILVRKGQPALAGEHARLALVAVGQEHSGFRYHPKLGLVGDKYQDVCKQLAAIV